MNNRPIGIFDSGIGGLTVAREIFHCLPAEKIIYFGDTARLPYGTKSQQVITHFTRQIIKFLLEREVKLIVVACNTASALALPALTKRHSPVPLIGVIEPGVTAALQKTKNGKIGIIGTEGTIRSKAYEKMILDNGARKIKVFSQACPLFVPLVEEGWLDKEITSLVAQEYLSRFKKNGIDTLILGCTHYPLLKRTIDKILGKEVKLIDSGRETAWSVKKFLEENNLFSSSRKIGRHVFYVTDAPEKFKKVGEKFLGEKIKEVNKVELK